MLLRALPLLLLVVACETSLTLPTAPLVAEGPVIDGVEPLEAYAGQRIRITGRHLGGAKARIFIGSAGPLDAIQPDGDGTLVVLVPNEATAGAVTVETELGRGVGPTFTPLGPGRPQSSRINASLDLRPRLEVAGSFGDGRRLVLLVVESGNSAEMIWTELDATGNARVLPWTGELAAWVAPDGLSAYTVRMTGSPLRWVLSRRTMPSGAVEQELELRDSSLVVADYETPRVMADPTGRWIVVAGGNGTFYVTHEDSTLAKVRAVTSFGEPVLPPDAVWLGGGRFAIEQRTGIALVDVANPTANPRLLKPDPSLPYVRSMALATGRPGELAVATLDRASVRFFSIPDVSEPLAPEGFVAGDEVPLGAIDYATFLAVTPDGERIAFADEDRLTVHARNPAVGALAATEGDDIRSVHLEGRTFVYTNGPDIVTVSAETGNYLGRVQAKGSWTPPMLGWRTCPGVVGEHLYVETISKTMRTARVFDAATLNPVNCGAIALPPGGAIIAAARHPQRDERYVLSVRAAGGAVLERHDGSGQLVDQIELPSFLRDCAHESWDMCRFPQQLLVSEDGSRLAVFWSERDSSDEWTNVVVLDNGLHESAAWGEPHVLEFPVVPVGALVTRDRVVLTEVQVYAANTADLIAGSGGLAWTAPEQVTAAALGMIVGGDRLTGDRLFVIDGDNDHEGFLLDLATGDVLAEYADLVGGTALFMTPGRREAYWWRRRTATDVEYGTYDFDVDGRLTGATLIGPLPVPMDAVFSRGGSGLFMTFTPDGARGYLGGELADFIYVIE